MPVFSLIVSYDGSPFCGFARQPGQPTVQGNLEDALSMLFRREVKTVCAGRTDTGVHALGQVVSFWLEDGECEGGEGGEGLVGGAGGEGCSDGERCGECERRIEREGRSERSEGRTFRTIERSVNALTDDLISVRGMQRREPDFSARFSALSREYRYFICVSEQPPIFTRGFAWHIPHTLDLDAMREGSTHLIGEHDFKSFCLATSAEGKPTCRNVMEIDISQQDIMGEPIVCIKVVGNAFLHSMIRAIVGTLVLVGRGKRPPAWVTDVLNARDRTAAGENAPAKGLVFWHVEY